MFATGLSLVFISNGIFLELLLSVLIIYLNCSFLIMLLFFKGKAREKDNYIYSNFFFLNGERYNQPSYFSF